MTELYINNQLCDLPEDFNITLVTENLYFSKASTYTYDVMLPMAPDTNNAKIFSHINRLDKSLENISYPARLVVDNKLIINGTATIVGISQTGISVQLLQGNSELNYKQRYEKTYIDELDLGTVEEWGLEQTVVVGTEEETFIEPIEDIAVNIPGNAIKVQTPEALEAYNDGNVIFTPIRNTTTDRKMNGIRCVNGVVFISTEEGIEMFSPEVPNCFRMAPQPKFSFMLEKIFNAVGLQITYNELDDVPAYQELFIANSTTVWKIADILPHFTLIELIEQIQVLFNCVFVIKEDNTVNIYQRRNYYSATAESEIVKVEDVIDEFEVDIDTEESVSDSDKAKCYEISYEDFGKDFLGEDFKEVPIVGINELPLYPKANPNVFAINLNGHKVSSPSNTNGHITGRNLIDHYMKWPMDVEEEFKLKIIPVYPEYMSHAEYKVKTAGGSSNEYNMDIYFPMPESVGSEPYDEDETYTIQEMLDDGETPPEKEYKDKICVGFVAEADIQMGFYTYRYKYLTSQEVHEQQIEPYPDWRGDEEGVIKWYQAYDMSFMPLRNWNGTADVKNFYNQFTKGTPQVLISKIYTMKFINNKFINVMSRFLIKNQLFACKQIKYSINAKGFDKIIEGEFYKI